jgi:ATP-dependent DNA ligase
MSLQHGTAAAEVTRDRNQKAESAEKEGGKKFCVHEIKHDGFRLMMRPAALSTRRRWWAANTPALAFAGLAAAAASPTIRGKVDAQGIARSDQIRFTLDNGPSRLRLACSLCGFARPLAQFA